MATAESTSTRLASGRRKATATRALGLACMASPAVAPIVTVLLMIKLDPIVLVIFGVALSTIAPWILRRAKQYASVDAQDAMVADPRPPVVYLRSFNADRVSRKPISRGSWFTEEENFARMVQGIGPFVAIGEPGESLPDIGAARLYVADSEWQAAVTHLLTRCRLAVLRVGPSESLFWELQALRHGLQPEQVALLVPRDAPLYAAFRAEAWRRVRLELPVLANWRKRWWIFRRGSLQHAIYFGSDWRPIAVDLHRIKVPFFRWSLWTPLTPVMQLAFQPFLQRLQLPAPPPPFSRSLIVVLAFVVALCLAEFFAMLNYI